MPRRPKRDKKRQARLTFEPAGDGGGDGDGDGAVGASSSPAPAMAPTFSTAKVRYSRAALLPPAATASGSPSRPSPSSFNKPAAAAAAARTKTKGSRSRSRGSSQSRLPDSSTIGVSTASSPPQKPPSASFMPQQRGVKRATFADSSDESAAEVDDAGRDEDDDEDDFPLVRQSAGRNAPRFLDADGYVPVPSSAKNPRSSQSVSTRLQNTVIIDDDDEDDEDEEDDDDIVPPSSALKRRRPLHSKLGNVKEEEDDDDDDVPILPPSSALRRRRPAMIELEDDEEDGEENGSPTKKRKTNHPAPSSQRIRRLQRPPPSPVKRTVHKGHRSEKEKKMELLRRRRAGEKIDKLSSSESESEGERQHRGIYDTDSEDEFKVLKEFDDDEDGDEPKEEEEEVEAPRSSRKQKAREAPTEKGKVSEDGVDGLGGVDGDDLDDFVVEDEDGLLGAPAEAIPLEFTAQAHRPLKDQFPYAVEWLVHNRLNPAFERRDPVYANAWRKLDDEFRGLASSKFASAAWRTEFYRALKGRPNMEAYEMDGADADKYDNCAACGRSGHPATFKIVFQGTPYHKDTLQEVDDGRGDEDSDSGSDDDDDSDNASIDTQGMPLPPASREWRVGSVCCSNAETAHGLIHWKHALMEWVEERLENEGWIGDAEKARERERMKARKRRDLANRIADGWRDQGVVAALYRDWRNTLEAARTKATTGRGRMR